MNFKNVDVELDQILLDEYISRGYLINLVHIERGSSKSTTSDTPAVVAEGIL